MTALPDQHAMIPGDINVEHGDPSPGSGGRSITSAFQVDVTFPFASPCIQHISLLVHHRP
jgi:hypothetical protein